MRQLLKSIGNLYLYSSLHISICAGLLTIESFIAFHAQIDFHYPLFIAFSTMFIYSGHRLIGMEKVKAFSEQGRYQVIQKYRQHILLYFILSGTAAAFYFLKLSTSVQISLLLPLFLTSLYILPIFKNKLRLRDFPFIKIFLIAIVWSWLCMFIPIALGSEGFDNNILYLLVLERFFFFIAITIPFDIRDYEVDSSINVKTLIHLVGIPRAKYLALLCLIICFLCIYFLLQTESITGLYFSALSLSYLVSAILIILSNQKFEDWFFGGFMDGLIGFRLVLWIGLYYLFQ